VGTSKELRQKERKRELGRSEFGCHDNIEWALETWGGCCRLD
jgi:hypothetical protein